MSKTTIKNALIGGFMGALMSGLMNYFIFPIPKTLIGIALSNSMSGFLSGFLGVAMYIRQNNNAKRKVLKV